MVTWKQYLNHDSTEWLLEENNPSVRYFTLRDILDRPPHDQEVVEAAERIMAQGAVPKILEKQNEGGYWGKPQDFYLRSKYRGTVWSFILLAELAADGRDPRIRQTCEFVLENVRDHASGAFAFKAAEQGGGNHADVIPCLTGNMLWSLIRFGYLDDLRAQQGLDWVVTYQRCEDRIPKALQGWPYERPRCWGRHTCHMGVIKILRALAEIPLEKRSLPVKQTIDMATEYFLAHHIYKRSHNLAKIAIPNWVEFGFPLMPYSDALEVLGVLVKLGCRDSRLQEAVDLVVSRQDDQGRWLLERSFAGRYQTSLEPVGQPSKWITLRALTALKGYYGDRKVL